MSAGECGCQWGAEQTPSSLSSKAFSHLDLKENCHLLEGGEPFASCEEAGVCRIAACLLGFIAALQGSSDQAAEEKGMSAGESASVVSSPAFPTGLALVRCRQLFWAASWRCYPCSCQIVNSEDSCSEQ